MVSFWPHGALPQRDSGLLQAEEDDGVHDPVERCLDIGEGFHWWEPGAENISAANDSGSILAAFVIALVEVTELFAAKGGGAAGDAILLEMAAEGNGHRASQAIAVSFQLSAVSEQ